MADPEMTQALMAMLPMELRAALDGGADPADLAQTLLKQRLQQAEQVDSAVEEDEEPWPELGWDERGPQAPAETHAASSEFAQSAPSSDPLPDPRLLELARALGACVLCFGDAPDCPVCGGLGAPGWALPEPSLFTELVVPALRRLDSEELRHTQGAVRRFSSPPPNTTNGHSAGT
jgi:hypothetical protein